MEEQIGRLGRTLADPMGWKTSRQSTVSSAPSWLPSSWGHHRCTQGHCWWPAPLTQLGHACDCSSGRSEPSPLLATSTLTPLGLVLHHHQAEKLRCTGDVLCSRDCMAGAETAPCHPCQDKPCKDVQRQAHRACSCRAAPRCGPGTATCILLTSGDCQAGAGLPL